MPLFFFHVRSPTDFIQDEEGSELPDLAAARLQARQAAAEICADCDKLGGSTAGMSFEVTDGEANPLFIHPFKEAGPP